MNLQFTFCEKCTKLKYTKNHELHKKLHELSGGEHK